jgi:hypothetical protein
VGIESLAVLNRIGKPLKELDRGMRVLQMTALNLLVEQGVCPTILAVQRIDRDGSPGAARLPPRRSPPLWSALCERYIMIGEGSMTAKSVVWRNGASSPTNGRRQAPSELTRDDDVKRCL